MPNILLKQKRTINKIKNKYWRTTSKFGVKLPHTAEEALAINAETGTNLWAKAINKENMKVKVAWEVRDNLTIVDCRAGDALIGYKEINCHMILDVKMDFHVKRDLRLVEI